jgi:hypothetical protein
VKYLSLLFDSSVSADGFHVRTDFHETSDPALEVIRAAARMLGGLSALSLGTKTFVET